MKKVAGRLRSDLAQFRELAAFAQFGSDLDKATRDQLERGQRLTELLKQPQYEPMRLDHEVLIIFAATNGYLDDVAIDRVRPFETGFLRYMDASHEDIGQKIVNSKDLDADTESALRKAIQDFKVAGAY